jgi:hypothetical protein
MSSDEPRHWTLLRMAASLGASALALILIFGSDAYAPENERHLAALMTFFAAVILYFDWRKGLFSGPISALHQTVRERGSHAFGCLQPLPMLGLWLSIIANTVVVWRG